MIGADEARALIAAAVPRPRPAVLPALEALGSILAEDVCAPFALPRFDNSAMDGFAFRAADTESASLEQPSRLPIRGAAHAGDRPGRIAPGSAWRIMTGAPMPAGANTVLPVEKSEVFGSALLVRRAWPAGRNVRRSGEEILRGSTALPKQTVLTPAAIGILATLGRARVRVCRKPRVSVLTTGSELAAPGSRLAPGQIYDSNSRMIHAALLQMGIAPLSVETLRDRPAAIRRASARALASSDAVILTGGVSMGETDYVKPILKELGVRTIFWKVRQKPGKPLFFGKKGRTLVFGLPGNPASVFLCFYEYVYPALRLAMGFAEPGLHTAHLPLEEAVEPDTDKVLMLKARAIPSNGRPASVRALHGQASHMLCSLGEANAFVVVPPSDVVLPKGARALVKMLPGAA